MSVPKPEPPNSPQHAEGCVDSSRVFHPLEESVKHLLAQGMERKPVEEKPTKAATRKKKKKLPGASTDGEDTELEPLPKKKELPKNANPCLEVGDLLIALESTNAPTFYTFNYKESQHLCRAVGQRLLVGRPNPDKPDVQFEASDKEWPPCVLP